MRPDASVVDDDARVTVRLRVRPTETEPSLLIMCNSLGLITDVARAEFMGISTKTMARVWDGQFGTEFMARAVLAFRRVADLLERRGDFKATLDELFDVTEPADELFGVAETALAKAA